MREVVSCWFSISLLSFSTSLAVWIFFLFLLIYLWSCTFCYSLQDTGLQSLFSSILIFGGSQNCWTFSTIFFLIWSPAFIFFLVFSIIMTCFVLLLITLLLFVKEICHSFTNLFLIRYKHWDQSLGKPSQFIRFTPNCQAFS